MVVSIVFYDFNKVILDFGGMTLTFDGSISSSLEYSGTVFTQLYAIISKYLPNFNLNKPTLSFLDCAVPIDDYDYGNLPAFITLCVVYLLLPLWAMWIKPIKRGLFRFWHLFWVADREVFCTSGLVCQNTILKSWDGEDTWLPKVGKHEQKVWNDAIGALEKALYKQDATWADVNYVRRYLNQRLDELTAALSRAEIGEPEEGKPNVAQGSEIEMRAVN